MAQELAGLGILKIRVDSETKGKGDERESLAGSLLDQMQLYSQQMALFPPNPPVLTLQWDSVVAPLAP